MSPAPARLVPVVERIAQLSPAQERLFAELEGPLGALRHYDAAHVWFEHAPELPRLQVAVDEVVRRHGVLRTSFSRASDGQWRQLVHAAAAHHGLVTQLSRAASVEDAVIRVQECQTDTVDPEASDHFRGYVTPVGSGLVWSFRIHHLQSDGWTLNLLYRAIEDTYRRAPSIRARATETTETYTAESTCMNRRRTTTEYARSIADATARLMAHSAESPLDQRGSTTELHCERQILVTPEQLLSAQQVLTARTGSPATQGITLLGILACWLGARVGGEPVTIGVMSANRRSATRESIMGNFQETLLVRVELAPERALAQLVDDLSAQVHDAMDRPELHVQDVQRIAGRRSLPIMTLAVNTMRTDSLALGDIVGQDVDVRVGGEALRATSVRYRWVFTPQGDGLRGSLTMPRSLDPPEEDLLQHQFDATFARLGSAQSCADLVGDWR